MGIDDRTIREIRERQEAGTLDEMRVPAVSTCLSVRSMSSTETSPL